MNKEMKSWLALGGIVALLIVGAVLSWVVTGSIPPNCHTKLDPGFCLTRKEKTFRDRPGARVAPIELPVLVSLP